MKKLLILIVLFSSNMQFAQLTPSTESEYERVYVEVGVVKPLGNLQSKFDTSMQYGFWFRSKIIERHYIDIGVTMMIPHKATSIPFQHNDSLFTLRSNRFSGNLGVRFAKVFLFSNALSKTNIEWNSGFGLATLFYDANHKRYDAKKEGIYNTKEDKNTYSMPVASILISQGIKFNYKNVGIQCHYLWTPYNALNEKIESNFGSQSVYFGILYRQ
jgi:hypothetical protein